MAWLVLVLSGGLEAAWAISLSRSDGFTRLLPSVVFAITAVASVVGLGYAMRTLPVGTAYAVWTGIGASLTVAIAMASGEEPVNAVRIALIVGLVGCVIGLKLVH